MRIVHVITLVAGLALFASEASAHAFIKTASPAVGSTVETPPSQVVIDFTEGVEPLFIRQRTEKAWIDQQIDQMRMLRQRIGEPRRNAEDESDEFDDLRIAAQQRKKASPSPQTTQEVVESGEG